ncbi:DUF1330 domain-containing protein, partial [Escherichia coli]|nr:DUF1330 domain-containing protein [Escherichia coli]
VKGGAQSIVEGQGPDRHLLIEFPNREQAMAWYNSPEYREILPVALRSSDRDLVIVEGI